MVWASISSSGQIRAASAPHSPCASTSSKTGATAPPPPPPPSPRCMASAIWTSKARRNSPARTSSRAKASISSTAESFPPSCQEPEVIRAILCHRGAFNHNPR